MQLFYVLIFKICQLLSWLFSELVRISACLPFTLETVFSGKKWAALTRNAFTIDTIWLATQRDGERETGTKREKKEMYGES